MTAAQTSKLKADPERHSRNCTICNSHWRHEMERAFVDWEAPVKIARKYRVQRSSLYLHAHALGLMEKRNSNVKAALARLIERSGNVQPNATALVSACVALSKLNEAGKTVERFVNTSDLDGIFDAMTRAELQAYAERGEVPERLRESLIATPTLPGKRLEVDNGQVN